MLRAVSFFQVLPSAILPRTVPSVRISSTNILRDRSGANTFFLTFDCGDDNTHIPYILDTLKKHGVKATFFMTGKFIERYPQDVLRIVGAGHTVGNHTYAHKYVYRSPREMVAELKRTEQLFNKVTTQNMAKLWRAPYLKTCDDPAYVRAAADAGYVHVSTTLYTSDWHKKQYLSNDAFLARFSKKDPDGSHYKGVIMLMHAGKIRGGGHDFVLTLDALISTLKGKKYLFEMCSKFCPKAY